MSNRPIGNCACALAVAAAAVTAQAQTINFVTTRVPTSTIDPDLDIRGNTTIRGLNDDGQFVGSFGERNWVIWNMPHAFIQGSSDNGLGVTGVGSASRSPEGYRLGAIQGPRYLDPQFPDYRYLDLVPSAGTSDFNDRVTYPNAISNSGVVVGGLSTDSYGGGPLQAFRYDTRTRQLSILSVPGAVTSEATDVNALGQVVGNFRDAAGFDHGFLFSNDTYTVIDMPGNVGSTRVGGINDLGQIVGSAYDYANPLSFIYSASGFTTFSANGLYTVASDINNSGQVVGWVGVSGQRRGFLYTGGTAVILDLSAGSGSTYAYTINNAGQIGGTVDGVGFLANVSAVPEPATAALLLGGIAAVFRRRRSGSGALPP